MCVRERGHERAVLHSCVPSTWCHTHSAPRRTMQGWPRPEYLHARMLSLAEHLLDEATRVLMKGTTNARLKTRDYVEAKEVV